MTSDRLFSSSDLGLKYKVVLQLSRLCLLANFPASTITLARGGVVGNLIKKIVPPEDATKKKSTATGCVANFKLS